MNEGFACTLGRDEVAERTALLGELASVVLEVGHEARAAVLRFPATAEDLVDRFVGLEARCCSFFTFAHDRVGSDLSLTVTVPDGAEPLLADLVASFDRDVVPGTRAVTIDRMRARRG